MTSGGSSLSTWRALELARKSTASGSDSDNMSRRSALRFLSADWNLSSSRWPAQTDVTEVRIALLVRKPLRSELHRQHPFEPLIDTAQAAEAHALGRPPDSESPKPERTGPESMRSLGSRGQIGVGMGHERKLSIRPDDGSTGRRMGRNEMPCIRCITQAGKKPKA